MSKYTTPLAFMGSVHDHAHCIAQALEKANKVCQQENVRFTPLRRQVFELIWQSHKPIGAYAILESLHNKQGGHAAPPTVYRALDFLLNYGLIHRIASLNAFVGCWHPDESHVGLFLICEYCGNATEFEAPGINQDIREYVDKMSFQVEKQTVELMGRCVSCQSLIPQQGTIES